MLLDIGFVKTLTNIQKVKLTTKSYLIMKKNTFSLTTWQPKVVCDGWKGSGVEKRSYVYS